MKTLPLTLLYHEGPIARAYLEVLSRAGYRVETILRMVPAPGVLARWMPGAFRREWQFNRNERLANHWPRHLSASFPALYTNMAERIEDSFDVGSGFLDTLRDGREIGTYAERVRTVELRNLRDPGLLEPLAEERAMPILFTGGGILPAAALKIPDIRFVHLHPGYLPDVRGADGLLWSSLVRGRPGVSAFLMAPGLDLGDLLAVSELEPLFFEVPAEERPSDMDLYRMIFSFYDPILRAWKLRSIIPMLESEEKLAGTPQNPDQGSTFHFMEPRMRHRALSRLFRRAEPAF